MASQMARFLVQADLIRSLANPLWNSSSLLPMDSVVGRLLHLFAGYEARPSGMQVVFYALTFLISGRHALDPAPHTPDNLKGNTMKS